MLHLWLVETMFGYMVVAAADEESVKELCGGDSNIADIDHLGYAVEGTKKHVICSNAERGEGVVVGIVCGYCCHYCPNQTCDGITGDGVKACREAHEEGHCASQR